jgi:hypothetical protein
MKDLEACEAPGSWQPAECWTAGTPGNYVATMATSG